MSLILAATDARNTEILIASIIIFIAFLLNMGSVYIFWRIHNIKKEAFTHLEEARQLRMIALDEKCAREETTL
jgi:hypothetical protein